MDSGASKGSNSNIPIELLLSYPYFWRPAKISKFAVAAAKVTEEVSPTKNQRSAQAVKSNWKNVLNNLKCNAEWPANVTLYNEKGTEQTLESLEITHFDILTRRYNVHNGRRDARKVPFSEKDFSNPMKLLKIVRDKHQHSKDMPPEFLKQLDWATADGNFDESKFGSYWTTHFPYLMPFLWVSFFPARTKKGSVGTVSSLLKEYYPEQSENRKIQLNTQDFPIDMEGLMLCLDKALQGDLERGGVTGRFTAGQTITVLEYRSLESGAIQRILDGKLILKIKLSSENVQCSWYIQACAGSKPVDESESKMEFANGRLCENTVIIIGNIIGDVHEITSQQLKLGSEGRIIVLLGKRDANDFLTEAGKVKKEASRLSEECTIYLPEKAVQWKELCQLVRETIISNGKIRIQNQIVGLDGLLPHSDGDRAEILSCLEGTMLNQLLRKMTPQVLHGLTTTVNSEIYVDRKVEKITVISKSMIDEAQSPELFVLSNIPIEKVQTIFPQKRKSIVDKSDFVMLQYRPTIFVMGPTVSCGCKDILSALESKGLHNRNIHLVRWMHGSVFKYLKSHGSISFLQESCVSVSSSSQLLEENFLDVATECWGKGQIVAISDTPGNGKSRFLLNQARKSGKLGRVFTVFQTMSSLVEKVVSDNVDREVVVDMFSKLFGSTEFERRLCLHWLLCKDRNSGTQLTQFGFFLDALDEVMVANRPKAEAILKVIQDLPNADLCIALRDHILEDFQNSFKKSAIFKLEPFSPQLQEFYLIKYWKSKANGSINGQTQKRLKNFANKILREHLPENGLQIAGTPLICSILAEVYESQALSGDKRKTLTESNSVCGLYDLMWKRKLEIWLGKQGMPVTEKEKHSSVVSAMRADTQNGYTYLAIKLLFSEQVADKFKSCLLPSKQSWERLRSTVLQQGIITCLDPVTFLHQTFAEDLVSRFVVAVFEGDFLSMPVHNSDFEDFLFKDVLAVQRDAIYLKHPTLCNFINAIVQGKNWPSMPDDIWFSLFRTFFLFPSTHEGYKYTSWFRAAQLLGLRNLFALLLNSPKYLFNFFVLASKGNGLKFCKYTLQNHADMIFDPESWTKYCTLDSQNRYSKEHWFFQNMRNLFSDRDILNHKIVKVKWTPTYYKKIMAGVMEKARFILERKDSDGKTPLLFLLSMPVSLGAVVLAKDLVADLGATENVNAVDNFGNTVLHVSHKCTTCHSKCSRIGSLYEEDVELYVQLWKLLLESGCDKSTINAVNCNGETPLFSAINAFKEQAVYTLEFFKDNGADFNAKDKEGASVLEKAICVGKDRKLVDALIEYGAGIDGIGKSGSIFPSLIVMNCVDALEKCIEKCWVDFRNLSRQYELVAINNSRYCDNKPIKKLFDTGKYADAIYWDGDGKKKVELVELYVEGCRFNVNVKGTQGKTRLLKLKRLHNKEVTCDILEKNALNGNAADTEMIFEKEIGTEDEKLVDPIIECQADISVEFAGKKQPLSFTVSISVNGLYPIWQPGLEKYWLNFPIQNESSELLAHMAIKHCMNPFIVPKKVRRRSI